MKVYVKGGGEVKLTKGNFIASGGEGAVYAIGGTAYKVYHDPRKMIPVGKIDDLKTIDDPRILRPQKVLCDRQGAPIGWTGRFIRNAWTLCQLFPKSFRNRHGLTHDQMTALVQKFRGAVQSVHAAKALVVDLNEMNALVAKTFDDIFLIDTDSFQTEHYPATAIMRSVQDPLVNYAQNGATVLSDWFSFAVVTFNMFVGIHPFKGKYKGPDQKLKALLPGETDKFNITERRMVAGVSVLNDAVGVPGAVYPFDVIPPAYRSWYEQVFEQGKRLAPPSDHTGGTVILVPVIKILTGTRNLDIMELLSYDSAVVDFREAFGTTVAVTTKGLYLGTIKVHEPVTGYVGTAFTSRLNKGIVGYLGGNTLKLVDLVDRKDFDLPIHVEQAMASGGRFYVKLGVHIHEVLLTEMGGRVLPTTQQVANCMEKATKLYDGCAIEDRLGNPVVTLFPATGQSFPIHLEELKEYRVVDARAVRNVLMVIGHKNGQYDRLVFRFSPSTGYKEHDVRTVEDISPTGLNFTVLDTGVAACLTEEEHLELFAAKRGHASVKDIEDKVLGSDLVLGCRGNNVVFWRGGKVYRVKSK